MSYAEDYELWKRTIPESDGGHHELWHAKARAHDDWRKKNSNGVSAAQPGHNYKTELRIIIAVLLAILVLLLARPAHAQFSHVNSINFESAGSGISGGFFTYPFNINCGTNMACSVSGNTVTVAASSTASTAFSAITASTNSNSGTFSVTGNTWDFSAATLLKLRVGAACTTSTNGDACYDSTNDFWHIWQGGADRSLIAATNLGASGQPCMSNADGSCTFRALVNGDIPTTLTGITLDGVTPTTFGYVDPTSSIQTQLNGKQATFGSQTANYFFAAPNGSSGSPSFRAIVAADVPTLNQNTTGNAATATNLASYPTLCTGSQFSQGLSAGSNNCSTPSGGSFTPAEAAKTGNYTITATDFANLTHFVFNCSSACAATLPSTAPTSGGRVWIESIGSTLATVSLNGLNFNGASSVPVLNKFRPLYIVSDGSNYFGDAPLVASTNVTLTPASNGLSISASGGSSGSAVLMTNTASQTPSGTQYLPISGGNFAFVGGSTNYLSVVPRSGTLSNLYVHLYGNEGGSATFQVLIYHNGSTGSLQCTVPNSSSTCNDTSDTVSVSAGDTIAWQTIQTGTGSGTFYAISATLQ
jgi:hypothetical protein